MKKKVSKFLEFNGKTLVFLVINGKYWVALKHICEALNVDYNRTYKNVTADPIFGQLLAAQPMTGADGKTYKMVALPEKWVYGWLISIQSSNPELIQYKKHCYEILDAYFHGSITGRKELLGQKAQAQLSIDQVMNTLTPDNAIKFKSAKGR